MREVLKNAGRSNVKTLAFSAKKGAADFKSELERIRAHQLEKKLDFSWAVCWMTNAEKTDLRYGDRL